MPRRARRFAAAAAQALLGIALLLLAAAARADAAAAINALRAAGCNGHPAIGTPLQPDPALDEVARDLSRLYGLQNALGRAGYVATVSTSLHIQGSPEDDAILKILAERSCDAIGDARYDAVGVFQSGDETWIVLAAARSPLPQSAPDAVAERVLTLVNAARAEARRCGDARYDAADALTLSAPLNDVALGHARDMAQRGYSSHRGTDGSSSADRITRSGYLWLASGENVAAGQRDAEAVVAAWIGSPGHCANLMAPHFTEMGVAFVLAPSKNPAIYWVQVFATPRLQ